MTTRSTSTEPGPKMRKDVLRNRALLLQTADALITERGLDMTFHDLAAAAGVGVGTVYRHFADKDSLIDALVEQRFDAALRLLLAAEQLADPIESLRTAVMRVCELQQGDRAVWQILLSSDGRHRDVAEQRLAPVGSRIVERARASGRVRADLSTNDLPVLFWASGALNHLSPVRPGLWRRYITVMLDGFMLDPGDRQPADEPAMSDSEIRTWQPFSTL